jgi:acetyl-CoA synthetase
MMATREVQRFLAARDFLLRCGKDYETAYREFRWPELERFNWATDFFDEQARGNLRPALWLADESGAECRLSFAEMARRSNQVANFLRRHGVGPGDRILLMVGNVVALWEAMLAAMKLGAALIPCASMLTTDDLRDRVERGAARYVIAEPSAIAQCDTAAPECTRILVGGKAAGWSGYEDAYDAPSEFLPGPPLSVNDPYLLYFTSGTTARPKLVVHTRQSYAVGHLATMFWMGYQPDDVHWNISSPGWAKHAYSSFFAPWNAGVTTLAYNYGRFEPRRALELAGRCGVTTLCAPATVWRMFVQEDLRSFAVRFRELVSAGEPLNPEVILKVAKCWGITIREGFGQTENTLLIGNFPGQPVRPGAMGRPTPGHSIALLDGEGHEANEGELALRLDPRPVSLMVGYLDDPTRTAEAMASGFYRTGDVAVRDEEGVYTYVGRADDVFKSSDYRLSPFELESALLEHEAVAEAAVIPSPDPVRSCVPKAYVMLALGYQASLQMAEELFEFVRGRLAPYQRVRRIQFVEELPKTISGKIRRVQLRSAENSRQADRHTHEYWEEDCPRLRASAKRATD